MSEIIRVENLSYIYNQGMPDATKALDDVSFTVEEGDFVGIIGSTGSGKSTLISHFNGLNRPTSGRVLVDGRDLWEQGADLRSFRFLVGLVMQYPEYQLFEETCARDIAYGPRNMGLDEAEVQRRVREAAAFVGLSDELLEKSPFELSGGQKRRVAIAGVMAMHPRVLVLDEPAAGLDPEGRDTILSQIRDYHEKTGITVLLVSHSMEDIAKYANRVLVMHRAKIAMYDTVENVFARAQELLELGLSVPQVTQIFLKLRQMGLDIPVVPGIMPITSSSQLIRFSDACGAEIPRWIRLRLQSYGDDVASIKAFGHEVVADLCERLLEGGAPSLHFYTMNQAGPTTELCKAIGA